MYIPYKLSGKIIDWKQKWFYIGNHGNTLPVIAPGPPIQRIEWNKKPIDDSQVPDLLGWIANLKQNQLTGEAVILLDETKDPTTSGPANIQFSVSRNK